MENFGHLHTAESKDLRYNRNTQYSIGFIACWACNNLRRSPDGRQPRTARTARTARTDPGQTRRQPDNLFVYLLSALCPHSLLLLFSCCCCCCCRCVLRQTIKTQSPSISHARSSDRMIFFCTIRFLFRNFSIEMLRRKKHDCVVDLWVSRLC